MNRIIAWFSCGAASAVATKLAILDNANRLPLVVARCIVKEEHPDNDRFAKHCENWFGIPITNLTNEDYNGSIYNVFKKRSYIAGIQGAPCTMILKKRVRENFEKPGDQHVFGYTAEEANRWNNFLDANNINAKSPLIERGLTHSDCLAVIERAGIEIPTMYKLGYKHNNCIGCVKATGAGYWNKVRKDFPEQFEKIATLSRHLKVRMTEVKQERIYLDELNPNAGNYKDEPEIQCSIFCEMTNRELGQ